MCNKHGWLTSDQVDVANIAYLEGYEQGGIDKWQPISNCPIETPVIVAVQGHVQNFIVEKYADGSWFAYGGEDELEYFYPTYWTHVPSYG
jgi:hypothetical protein